MPGRQCRRCKDPDLGENCERQGGNVDSEQEQARENGGDPSEPTVRDEPRVVGLREEKGGGKDDPELAEGSNHEAP